MKEHNLFELIGRLLTYIRKRLHRTQTNPCPKTNAGHRSINFLWFRYTLTDTELIFRTLGTRRVDLRTLRIQSRVTPPLIHPGKSLRFTIDGAEYITLRHLHYMEGSTHFVLLLGKATGLDLIEPYLGFESRSNSVRLPGL